MAELAPDTSALGGLLMPRRIGAVIPPGVVLAERPVAAIWQIACWRAAAIAPVTAAIGERLGVALPEAADRATGGPRLRAFRVAPRRWWLVARDAVPAEVEIALRQAVAGTAALTDLGHGRIVLILAGPDGRAVLARLCRIDLHPGAFGSGRVAQTRLGQVAVLLHALDEPGGFELYVPRSLARSAVESLIDAAAEFGLTIGD